MSLITLKTTSWYVHSSGERRSVESDLTKDMPQERLKLILDDANIKTLLTKGSVTVKMLGRVYFKYEIIS